MKNLNHEYIRLLSKWFLFPGLDLITRSRYRFLPLYFQAGQLNTLDAGCGNGALSYAAHKLGNNVLGVTKNTREIEKARKLFLTFGVSRERLQFEVCDLYDLPKLNRKFNQIICSETLEHIKLDNVIVRHFYDLLSPGGVLHLCSPFALHPEHKLGRINGSEDGGHVRDGYTLESYRSLLEPVGFKIVKSIGLGSPLLIRLDRLIRRIRNKAGDGIALPLFLLTMPLQLLDFINPPTPHSLYVEAIKQ